MTVRSIGLCQTAFGLLMVVALAACGNDKSQIEQPRPVLVAQVGSAAVASSVTAYAGEIRAREEPTLSFRLNGKVLARRVDAGDRVRRGDILAELDPLDLQLQAQASQAQLSSAEAQLVRNRADQSRFAALAKDQLVSRSALDQQTAALHAAEAQVRAARAQMEVAGNQSTYAVLRAPRDGVIATRLVEAGQVIKAGDAAFSLAADSGREVAFALPETGIRGFHVGQPVVIELWSAQGQRLAGRIREIAPAADPQTRTYAARAALDGDAANAVDLGQSARVYIPEAQRAGIVEVPLTALQPGDQGGTAVWVADPKAGRVHRTVVQVGPFGAETVPVLAGLAPTQWVVIAGGHLLQEDQRVVLVDRSNRPITGSSKRID